MMISSVLREWFKLIDEKITKSVLDPFDENNIDSIQNLKKKYFYNADGSTKFRFILDDQHAGQVRSIDDGTRDDIYVPWVKGNTPYDTKIDKTANDYVGQKIQIQPMIYSTAESRWPRQTHEPIELVLDSNGQTKFDSAYHGLMLISFVDQNDGQLYNIPFNTLRHRFAPTFKFQLIKSEGNDNHERSLEEINRIGPIGNRSSTSWGKFDLVIDLRETYIHDYGKFGYESNSRPGEGAFFNAYDWVQEGQEDITFKMEFDAMPIQIDIESVEVDHEGEPIDKQEVLNEDFGGIYSSNPEAGEGKIEVFEDGYTRIRIKEVIDVPETHYITDKGDDDSHNPIFAVESSSGKYEFRNEYFMYEGTSAIKPALDWGKSVGKDQEPPVLMTWNDGGKYIKFDLLPPIHVTGILLGLIALPWITTVAVKEIKKIIEEQVGSFLFYTYIKYEITHYIS